MENLVLQTNLCLTFWYDVLVIIFGSICMLIITRQEIKKCMRWLWVFPIIPTIVGGSVDALIRLCHPTYSEIYGIFIVTTLAYMIAGFVLAITDNQEDEHQNEYEQ